MFDSHSIAHFLKPSLLSFFVATLTACTAIGLASWSYVASTPLLFDFFYGELGVITAFEMSPDALDALRASMTAAFSAESEYRVAVILFAVIAGLVALFLVHTTIRTIKIIYAVRTETSLERKEQFQRVLLRITICALWFAYFYFYWTFVQPFSFLLSRIAAESLDPWRGAAFWLGSVLLLSTALHLHIIFARLALLRSRVFGG